MLANMSGRIFQIAKLSVNAERYLGLNMLTRSQIRSFSSENIQVRHDSTMKRFAAELNGKNATLDYHLKDNVITFMHTEVPDIFRGKGVGKVLAEEAFQHAIKNDLKVKIECDFVLKYFTDNNKKYKDIVIE